MFHLKETMIHYYVYWYGIINTAQIEVTNCFTYQRTKGQKYGKLTDKIAEEIPWNKLLVDLIDYMHLIKIPNMLS